MIAGGSEPEQGEHVRSEAGPRPAKRCGVLSQFTSDLSRRIRSITSLIRKAASVSFTPAMEDTVRGILAELAAPPTLVLYDWDAVDDGSTPSHVFCDACIDHFGTALEQKEPGGPVRPMAYISHAILDSGRHRTPLDLEVGSRSWRLHGFEDTPGAQLLFHFFGPQGLELSAQWQTTVPAFSGGSSLAPRSNTHSSTARAATKGNADFLWPFARTCHGTRLQRGLAALSP